MPHPRAWTVAVLAALLAAACAPGPSISASGPGPEATTTTAAPDSARPPTPPDANSPEATPPETGPPDTGTPPGTPADVFPVDPEDLPPLGPVDGRIAFHGIDAEIRSDNSTEELETGTFPSQPTWSRDGSRLAFVSTDGRVPTVDIFDGETGQTLARTPAERRYFFLSWSHDGTRIAALGPGVDVNGTNRTVLDILDADGLALHTDVAAAGSLFVAWDPASPRLVAHADDRLLRIDADGTATDLGAVGEDFFAPKWIPFSNEVVLVTDIEGSAVIVRRSVDGLDTLASLGPVESETGIAVNPTGDVAAISRSFEIDGGEGAERIDLPFLPQTANERSGAVEILDLETGERVEVFTGFALWTEWNPLGTHLLIYEADPGSGAATWWVYEHTTAGDPLPPTEIGSFTPTPTFYGSYAVFADQFIESPRLWSPDGDEFVYAELTDTGSLIKTRGISPDTTATTVGAGEVGFWSPTP